MYVYWEVRLLSFRMPAFFLNAFLALTVSFSTACHSLTKQSTVSKRNPIAMSFEPKSTSQPNKIYGKVYVDDKFSGTEREFIEKGLREWERATNGIIKWEIQKRGSWNSNQDVIDTPVPDMNTLVTECTHDIYVTRVFSGDVVVLNLERKIREEENREFELAGYATPTCQSKRFMIVADKILTEHDFIAVTEHEMGHILGLFHTFAK